MHSPSCNFSFFSVAKSITIQKNFLSRIVKSQSNFLNSIVLFLRIPQIRLLTDISMSSPPTQRTSSPSQSAQLAYIQIPHNKAPQEPPQASHRKKGKSRWKSFLILNKNEKKQIFSSSVNSFSIFLFITSFPFINTPNREGKGEILFLFTEKTSFISINTHREEAENFVYYHCLWQNSSRRAECGGTDRENHFNVVFRFSSLVRVSSPTSIK